MERTSSIWKATLAHANPLAQGRRPPVQPHCANVDDPPRLEPPDEILRRLVARLGKSGRAKEKTYLRSANPRHRWARSSFASLDDEFRFKTIWVAKLLRDKLGSPDHFALVTLAHSGVRGVRAAAWFVGPVVGYVVERRAVWSPSYVRVILGVVEPTWSGPPTGPDGLDARDAVWVPRRRVVH